MIVTMQKPVPPKESFVFEIPDLAPAALAGPTGESRLKLRESFWQACHHCAKKLNGSCCSVGKAQLFEIEIQDPESRETTFLSESTS